MKFKKKNQKNLLQCFLRWAMWPMGLLFFNHMRRACWNAIEALLTRCKFRASDSRVTIRAYGLLVCLSLKIQLCLKTVMILIIILNWLIIWLSCVLCLIGNIPAINRRSMYIQNAFWKCTGLGNCFYKFY